VGVPNGARWADGLLDLIPDRLDLSLHLSQAFGRAVGIDDFIRLFGKAGWRYSQRVQWLVGEARR
jgi:hypothetical protein